MAEAAGIKIYEDYASLPDVLAETVLNPETHASIIHPTPEQIELLPNRLFGRFSWWFSLEKHIKEHVLPEEGVEGVLAARWSELGRPGVIGTTVEKGITSFLGGHAPTGHIDLPYPYRENNKSEGMFVPRLAVMTFATKGAAELRVAPGVRDDLYEQSTIEDMAQVARHDHDWVESGEFTGGVLDFDRMHPGEVVRPLDILVIDSTSIHATRKLRGTGSRNAVDMSVFLAPDPAASESRNIPDAQLV